MRGWRTPWRKAIGAAGLLVLLLLAAGCGGGSSSRSDGSGELTKAQAVKAGDQICERALRREGQALAAYGKEQQKLPPAQRESEAEALGYLVTEVALPPIKDAVAELGRVEVGGGDQANLDAIVAGMEDAIEKMEAKPASASGASTHSPFEAVQRQATAFGFKVCSTIG